MNEFVKPYQKGSLWRGVIFHVGLVISVPIWTLATLPVFGMPFRIRYWWITRWCSYIRWLARWVAGIKVEVHGLENKPDTACVVLAKHQSSWETLNLLSYFYPQSWVLKRELLKVPVFGWALGRLDPIAINRKSSREALKQVINQGTERLRTGRWVVVFPEGTRVPVGARGRYQQGGALLACRAGVPVVPVAHNAGYFWPPRSIRMRAGTIQVRIGPPIETTGRTPAEVIQDTETWIESVMETLEP
ncbi:MAG: 1-acyl-sn-glycerol-3-phosphate acyltransferase [Gammaproteobacteria bacterium]|nr:1-acyl-sn-glycerol-3-phosphate acyltransferase [Gammaproteobacteria bacterium]